MKIIKCFRNMLLFSLFSLNVLNANAADGIYLERTRIIIEKGDVSGTVIVRNESDNNYLVKTQVENFDMTKAQEAHSLPNLYKAGKHKSSVIRVSVVPGHLPQDRESQFWLYTKFFPETTQGGSQSRLNINYVHRIKVFYRPKNLAGNIYSAIENLIWSVEDEKLSIKNNSAFNVTVDGYSVNGKTYQNSIRIEPFSSVNTDTRIGESANSLKWRGINDYGVDVEFERTLRKE